MKILNIENAVKYELPDLVISKIERSRSLESFEEDENGELLLKGKTLKDKGWTIYKIILLYVQKITGSMGVHVSEERIDFQQQVVPHIIRMQQHLSRLNVEPDDFDSFWELIETLDTVINYLNNHKLPNLQFLI